MKIQMILIIFIVMLMQISVMANHIFVTSVDWECEQTVDNYTSKQLNKVIGEYDDIDSLKDLLRESLVDIGITNISYELIKVSDHYHIHFKFSVYPRAKSVNVIGDIPLGVNKNLYIIPSGGYLLPDQESRSIAGFKKALIDKGYPKANVALKKEILKNGDANIDYIIDVGAPLRLKKINIVGGDDFLRQSYERELSEFLGRPIDILSIQDRKDDVDILMRDYAYYSLKTKLTTKPLDTEMSLDINYWGPYIFNFTGQKRFSAYELKKELLDKLVLTDQKVIDGLVAKIISTKYENAGYYQTEVTIKEQEYKTNNLGQRLLRYNVEIVEGERLYISRRVYRGNKHFSDKDLDRNFQTKETTLAGSNYLDEKFYELYPEHLKKYYAEEGYLLAKFKVRIPYVNKVENYQDTAEPLKRRGRREDGNRVEFMIREGNQSIIQSVEITDVNRNFLKTDNLLSSLVNQVEKPINPYMLESDVQKVVGYFQEQGYMKAQVVNENHADLVSYSKDAREVGIKYIVERGKRYEFSRLYIFGNDKTKDKLIEKRLDIKPGDVITPDMIEDFKRRLFSLGLFSVVKVYPKEIPEVGNVEGDNVQVILMVRVKEIEYGKIELIPGLRSDTGVKLGFNVGYTNLGGMGRALRFNSEVNQRIDYSVFDEQRNAKENKFLEYDLALGYSEFDVLKTDIHYLAQVGARRRRYFAFDANIERFANIFSYKLSDRSELTLGHQFEKIKQENGSLPTDNGQFKIGSIIPTINYDWRNNVANPTSGGINSLSVEWAHPLWLSQDNEELRIEFIKYVLRNRFYVPFKGGALALAWTFGIQKNLADGYIPGIKTFRLVGADIVRGFSDGEINRLPSGDDISQYKIEDNAYLNSLKIEPRFFLNKNVMLGLFWDAGIVTVERERIFDMRQSVGISFKILTPVGSINFDYGHKLKRETSPSGEVDSAGRFHLSIGLF